MLVNNLSTRASQALSRTGGGPLLLLRAMTFIDVGSRDLKPSASRQAQTHTDARRLRTRRQLTCRTVVRHLLRLEAASAAFNPHSAPPSVRRFSATGSFGYRSRGGIASLANIGTPRPLSKRLSALCQNWRVSDYLINGRFTVVLSNIIKWPGAVRLICSAITTLALASPASAFSIAYQITGTATSTDSFDFFVNPSGPAAGFTNTNASDIFNFTAPILASYSPAFSLPSTSAVNVFSAPFATSSGILTISAASTLVFTAFPLTPVPESSSLAMMGIGLLVLLSRCSRTNTSHGTRNES